MSSTDSALSERDEEEDDSANDFTNPLPGDETIWQKSKLGSASEWPSTLQAYSLTIASFAYPAAIYWGEELVGQTALQASTRQYSVSTLLWDLD